jgi:uncharacterized membrane protein
MIRISDFMEKKIKRTSKDNESDLEKNEEKNIVITIIAALVILGSLLGYLILFTEPEIEQFSAIYYLDSNKTTENIPEKVILKENSTFLLWVGVDNQNNRTIDYQVQLKIDTVTFPVGNSSIEPQQSLNITDLPPGENLVFPVTITIDEIGVNRIIFELWYLDKNKDDLVWTENWVNLTVEGIEENT